MHGITHAVWNEILPPFPKAQKAGRSPAPRARSCIIRESRSLLLFYLELSGLLPINGDGLMVINYACIMQHKQWRQARTAPPRT